MAGRKKNRQVVAQTTESRKRTVDSVTYWAELLGKPKKINETKTFELNPTWIGIITIVILVGMMFVSTQNFGDTIAKSKKSMYEEPLNKVKQLSVVSGEKYTYTQRIGNESTVDLTFWVMDGPGCTILSLGGRTADSFICIDKWGVENEGNNLSYSNPYIVMFKPWMLAIDDNWKWNATMGMQIGTLQSYVFQVNYSTISKGKYLGRDAWLIEMRTSDGNGTTYFWIDDKKRVLLLENGTDYEIELVDGVLINSTN